MSQHEIRRLDDKGHKVSPLTMLSPQSLPNPGEFLPLSSLNNGTSTASTVAKVWSSSSTNGIRTPSFIYTTAPNNTNDENNTGTTVPTDSSDTAGNNNNALLSIFTSELLANESRIRKVFHGIARRPDEKNNASSSIGYNNSNGNGNHYPISPIPTTMNNNRAAPIDDEGTMRQPLRTPQRPPPVIKFDYGSTTDAGNSASSSSSSATTTTTTTASILGNGTPQRNYSSLIAQPVTITSPHKPTETSVPRAKRSNIREDDISFVRNTVGTVTMNTSSSTVPVAPTNANTDSSSSSSVSSVTVTPNNPSSSSSSSHPSVDQPPSSSSSLLSTDTPVRKISSASSTVHPYNSKVTILQNENSIVSPPVIPLSTVGPAIHMTSPAASTNPSNTNNLSSSTTPNARRSTTKSVPTYALNTLAWAVKQEEVMSQNAVTSPGNHRSSAAILLSPSKSSSSSSSPKPPTSTTKGKGSTVARSSTMKATINDVKTPSKNVVSNSNLTSPINSNVDRSVVVAENNGSTRNQSTIVTGVDEPKSIKEDSTSKNKDEPNPSTAVSDTTTAVPPEAVPNSIPSATLSSSTTYPSSSPSVNTNTSNKSFSAESGTTPLDALPTNSFNDAPAIIAPPLLSALGNFPSSSALPSAMTTYPHPSPNPLSPFRVRLLPYSMLNSMNSTNSSTVLGSFTAANSTIINNANIIQHQIRLREAQQEYQKLLHQPQYQAYQPLPSFSVNTPYESNGNHPNNLSSLPNSEGPSPASTRPSSLRLPSGSPVSVPKSGLPHSALSPVYGPQHAHLPLYSPLVMLNTTRADSPSTTNGSNKPPSSSLTNTRGGEGSTKTSFPTMHVALVPMRESTASNSDTSASTTAPSLTAFERTLGNLHLPPDHLSPTNNASSESPYLGPHHPMGSPTVLQTMSTDSNNGNENNHQNTLPSPETDAVTAAAVLMERLNNISTAVETIREVIQQTNPKPLSGNFPPLLSESSSVTNLHDMVSGSTNTIGIVPSTILPLAEETSVGNSSGHRSPLHVTSRAESTGYSVETNDFSPSVQVADPSSNVSTYALPSPNDASLNNGSKSSSSTTLTGTVLSGPAAPRGIPSPVRHRPGASTVIYSNNYPTTGHGKDRSTKNPFDSLSPISSANPAWMGDGSEALLRNPVPITTYGNGTGTSSSPSSSKPSSPDNKSIPKNNSTANDITNTTQWLPGIPTNDTSANAVVAQLQYELRNELLALLGNEEEMNRLLNTNN